MSQGEEEGDDKILLADTDLFFFYLKGGKLAPQAKHVIKMASRGVLELRTSSEVYDDAISALRSDNVPMPTIIEFVSMMKSIPHRALALNAEVAEEALNLYQKYGGRRKLSYFDSFHAATAKRYDLTLLTSDGYMQDHADDIRIGVKDLRSITTGEE
ncbi:MAG TPA: PIN domain-containing protein [Nitrososphaerales archaeon]|nr:PIN domain-containing protein [Nitrososphaerales archaeon]